MVGGAPRLERRRKSLALLSFMARHAPALVINAAAFTHVDKAESEVEAAFALNADMPGRFAQAAAEAGVPFLHLSTDSVFDGLRWSPPEPGAR
jgi:dTDP-4-dehydrorhamnose reductase